MLLLGITQSVFPKSTNVFVLRYQYTIWKMMRSKSCTIWQERKKLDREVSVASTMEMLRKSGFKHVECVFEFMKFATITAVKE